MQYRFTVHRLQSMTPGFTILELLVSISIMATIFGVGFANYRGFQDRQRLAAARESLKLDLRFTQEQALAGVKPTGCNSLQGYKLSRVNESSYSISANCNGIPGEDFTVKTIDWVSKYPQVEVNPFSFVYFNVLGRGVRSPLVITLLDTKNNATTTVNITQGGEIY